MHSYISRFDEYLVQRTPEFTEHALISSCHLALLPSNPPSASLPRARIADSAAALAQFVPSCVEDFSRRWLLYVMQQYYANNCHEHNGATVAEIGEFRAQRLCRDQCNNKKQNKNHSDKDNNRAEMEGEREATTHESQHILSQAYKVMVDVPDPPKEELAADEGAKVN